MNIFEQIVDRANIEKAYFEVVEKLEETNRAFRYNGVDGYTLSSYDFTSEQLIEDIYNELIDEKKITPAIELHIPKRNKPGTRPVYIHTIKERIKAQAVYRIVLPFFDGYFSPYLFSYRSSHPHYRAVRTVVRKYNRDNSGYMIIGDISSYSDIINPGILKKQIEEIGLGTKTNRLLDLYVDAMLLEKGSSKSSPEGVITGLPITVMFNNLYLDSFDKIIGKEVKLYRRIGDDFIAFDIKNKLEDVHKKMVELLTEVKILPKSQKIYIQKISEPFTFLGYLFNAGTISIPAQSIKNIHIRLRKELRYYPFNGELAKVKILKKILFTGSSLKNYFIQIIRQYNHVNDMEQIRLLSVYFYRRLTIYFFGIYSNRTLRKTKKIIRRLKIPSLIEYYVAFQTGTYRGKDLKNIK